MLEIINLDDEEKKSVILNTSEKYGLKPYIIEKDLWVCYILDYLFNRCKYKDYFIFKGGTSLSKGYGIIKRFSEDIDIILDWNFLGYSDEFLYEDRNKTPQNKINKEVVEKCSLFLGNEFLKTMVKDLKKELNFEFKIAIDENDKDRCTINFYYPSIFQNKYTREEVRLEIGPLAEKEPSHLIEIRPYIAVTYKELFKGSKTFVRTVDAERTFWEKIAILHTIASGYKENNIPARYARHYYDIYCLAKSDIKQKAFENKDLFEKDIIFKTKFYYAKKASYETAYIGNVKLIPSDSSIELLRKDYDEMKEMFFDEYPSFNEILSELKILERQINKL